MVSRKNKLISKQQCAFRKQRSTIDHLVKLQSEVTTASNNKEHLTLVSFDIEKAYDIVWRHKVLQKLYNMGFRGRLPNFIQKFISSRKFQVVIGNVMSSVYEQQNGIPQGSVIAVTLFLIMINDISEYFDESVQSLLFADDLSIFM